MEPSPISPRPRRSWIIPIVVLIVCCALGFAGRWLFVRWIVSSSSVTINRARKSLATDRPEAVESKLRWLLWATPNQPEALLLLGSSLQAQKKVDDALASFDRIPATSKVHANASAAAALMCLGDSRLEAAELRLTEHLRQYPNSPDVRDELRWLYFNQLRTRDIETLLERELVRSPDEFRLAVDLMSSEFRKQLPREGIAYLRAADERHPNQAKVKTAIGYCQWQIGQTAEARKTFEAALELEPDASDIREMVAEFLLEQGGQLDQVRELLPATPTTDHTWYLLSIWAEHQGDIAAAEQHIQQALRMRAGELKYVQRRGELLRRLGKSKDASELLRQANRLEAVQTELSELALSRQHEDPSAELCQRLATLQRARGREIQAKTWERAAKFLLANPGVRPNKAGDRPYPAGRGPM